MRVSLKILLVVLMLQPLSGCSLNGLSARLSSYFIEQRMDSLNRESDLNKVKKQLLADIKQLETMLRTQRDPGRLHQYAARAYYAYAFAFLEDKKPAMAADYYYKAYQHGKQGLETYGLKASVLQGSSKKLNQALSKLPMESVDALYWSAMSWAKLIELKQPNLLLLTQLPKTAQLMTQVQAFDRHYNLGGPDLFFAVYYSVRPVYLGGNVKRASRHFEKARRYNQSRLLLVDYLQAKYHYSVDGTSRQKRQNQLKRIVRASHDIYPEQALINAVTRRKAARLLAKDARHIAQDQTATRLFRDQAGLNLYP